MSLKDQDHNETLTSMSMNYYLYVNSPQYKENVQLMMRGRYFLEKEYRSEEIKHLFEKIQNLERLDVILHNRRVLASGKITFLDSQYTKLKDLTTTNYPYPNVLQLIKNQITDQETISTNMTRYIDIITDIDKAILNADSLIKLILLQKDMKTIYHMSLLDLPIIVGGGGQVYTMNLTNVKEAFVLLYMKWKNIPKPNIVPDIILNYLQPDDMDIVNSVYNTIFSSYVLQLFYDYDQNYGVTRKWTPFSAVKAGIPSTRPDGSAYAYEILYDDLGMMKYVITSELASYGAFLPDSNQPQSLDFIPGTTSNQPILLDMLDILYNAAYQCKAGFVITVNIPLQRLAHILS